MVRGSCSVRPRALSDGRQRPTTRSVLQLRGIVPGVLGARPATGTADYRVRLHTDLAVFARLASGLAAAGRPAGRAEAGYPQPAESRQFGALGHRHAAETGVRSRWTAGVGSSRKRDLTAGTPQVVMDGPVSAGPSFRYGIGEFREPFRPILLVRRPARQAQSQRTPSGRTAPRLRPTRDSAAKRRSSLAQTRCPTEQWRLAGTHSRRRETGSGA